MKICKTKDQDPELYQVSARFFLQKQVQRALFLVNLLLVLQITKQWQISNLMHNSDHLHEFDRNHIKFAK